jgi:hypothetical protein
MMKTMLVLAAALMAGAASAATPANPDLSGVWFITKAQPVVRTADGKEPPLTPAGRAIYEANKAKAAKGDRSWDGLSYCLPPGLPRLMLMDKPFQIVQRPKTVYFIHQENRLPRRVYMDEKHPEELDGFYQGHSVGKWENGELVVDTVGFREGDTFIDMQGLPHSDQLHLTERYKLSADGKTLSARFTIEDPKDYSQPWSTTATYSKRVGYQIPEGVCAEKLETTAPRSRQQQN